LLPGQSIVLYMVINWKVDDLILSIDFVVKKIKKLIAISSANAQQR
jgi:hypothetical protein